MTSHRFRVTRTQLADARELLYFDDSEPYVSGEATRALIDPRDLPEVANSSEMRKDPLTGRWVAYAAHRMNRTFLPPANENPLAPSLSGQLPTEIPADDYDVVVFENRFPSFSRGANIDSTDTLLTSTNPEIPRLAARARCEVICFTPEYDKHFRELSTQRVRTVIEAWAHRTEHLSQLEGVKAVFPFENRGEEIGVTLQHPHGQIYAYPFIPPRLEAILQSCRTYLGEHGRSLFDDLLTAEHAAGDRIIARGEHFTTLVPPAAKWPVEAMLIPHRDVADFTDLNDEEKGELATMYLDLLGRVDRFFEGVDKLPYIAGWHQAPVGSPAGIMRLHLSLFSLMRSPNRMKFLAGSESAMEVWVNDTTPEKIAERFREISSPLL